MGEHDESKMHYRPCSVRRAKPGMTDCVHVRSTQLGSLCNNRSNRLATLRIAPVTYSHQYITYTVRYITVHTCTVIMHATCPEAGPTYLSMPQHHDDVSISNRAEPMGHDERGALLAQRGQRGLQCVKVTTMASWVSGIGVSGIGEQRAEQC